MLSRNLLVQALPQELSVSSASSDTSLSAVENALIAFSNLPSIRIREDWPLKNVVDQLMRVSGTHDQEAATVAYLSAIGATVADCVYLEYAGRTITSSMNFLFIGGESLGESSYLSMPFTMLRRITGNDLSRAANQLAAEERLKQACLRFRKSVKTERNLHRKLEREVSSMPGVDLKTVYERAKQLGNLPTDGFPLMSPKEAAALAHSEAQEECEQALNEMVEANRAVYPLVICESVGLDDALRARRFANRKAILSVDSTHRQFGQLLQCSEKLRGEFASACRASFDNAIIIDKVQPKPAPWFSFAYMANRELLRRFVNDPTIIDEGITGRTMLVDLTSKPAVRMELEAALEQCPEFSSFLQACHGIRSKHEEVVVQLSSEALKTYEAFCNEANKLCIELPVLRQWIEHWPSMALKLALLLHISTGINICSSIPKETMDKATTLFKIVSGRGLLLLLRQGELKPPEDARLESEIELLVAKVRLKGPLSRRDLVRSYHGKRMTALESLLSRAIGMGLIEEEQGLLRPAPCGM